eukprot:4775308-Amphidinium_carterae.1
MILRRVPEQQPQPRGPHLQMYGEASTKKMLLQPFVECLRTARSPHAAPPLHQLLIAALLIAKALSSQGLIAREFRPVACAGISDGQRLVGLVTGALARNLKNKRTQPIFTWIKDQL